MNYAQFVALWFSEECNIEKLAGSSMNTLLNADSIYLTSYAVLSLTFRLHMNDFYTSTAKQSIPVSEV